MEIFLIIIAIAIILIYTQLSHKIKHLENEITQLRKNTTESISKDLKEVTQLVDKEDNIYKPQPEVHEFGIENETPQKDWISPVFDFLKQNVLTIIGIFTLVLGLGYFVKYAVDKSWIGEQARTGIGMGMGIAIIILGYFLHKNYRVFSSIITGGGIAVLYFTTTIAFREYHLFTQNLSFVITCFITLISIALSYYYKSEVLSIFGLIGGFSAPLMISTGQSNYLFLFTYISILNIGILLIVFLKHWRNVGWIGFVLTSLYLFYWTFEKPDLLSIVFYILTYFIFYVYALQNYIKKNTLSTNDILMLVLINFTTVLGSVWTFNSLQYEPIIIFPIAFALLNSILLFKENRKNNVGKNFSVFTALTVSLITIAIALQFKTHLVTTVWAIEATLLLFIWTKTRLAIFKNCFYILLPLLLLSQMITWTEYTYVQHLDIIVNPVFLTSSVTIITTIFNFALINKHPDLQAEKKYLYHSVYQIVSFGIIYFALLFEIIYHISVKPWAYILGTISLFSLYYIFIILLLGKKINLNKRLKSAIICLLIMIFLFTGSISASTIAESILMNQLPHSFYFFHLSYWIPFIYVYYKMIPESAILKCKPSYPIISLVFIVVISFEFYHLFILSKMPPISQVYLQSIHFISFYLPLIWAVMGCIFIYNGIRKNIPEISKIGFVLIGTTVLKFYIYDVWKMDNISRIIAFIILGIILLLSSFLFQRLKNIIKNLVDKKKVNNENQ